MLFGLWNQPKVAFHDRAFERAALPSWDARWHTLSVPARSSFLDTVKVPQRRGTSPSSVPATRFPPAVLDELVGAGFLVQRPVGPRQRPQVALAEGAIPFLVRLRALRRYHLLTDSTPDALEGYIGHCFVHYGLVQEIHKILRDAGLNPHTLYGNVYRLYVSRHRWPGWVVHYLKDPLAQPLLDAIESAGGQLPPAHVLGRLAGHSAEAVRATLDRLLAHLVLFEDLEPDTLELLVGLLPSVRADLQRVRQPRQRPALVPCPDPKEIGSEGGIDVPDLRAFLLELAGAPARLRQNHTLFQKEAVRFLAVLDPLPGWLVERYELMGEARLDRALRWARSLKFVQEGREGEHPYLRLGPRGQKWLTRPLEGQYAVVYDYLRAPEMHDLDPFGSYHYGDSLLLGARMTAARAGKGHPGDYEYQARLEPEQVLPLRQALRDAFHQLPAGTFIRVDSFIDHAVYGRHNPLLLGQEPAQAAIRVDGRLLPPLEEQQEEAARSLLTALLNHRLIPLGCVQAALDGAGQLVIARLPRLDAYFLSSSAAAEETAAPAEETRVVVQPDFSIIIIGLNPAPAADLAPFCDRKGGRSSQGALTLTLTRESVVRGVANGLSASEILGRLQRHSSTPLPDNVAHEVRAWCDWVRTVSAGPLTVFRCPDAATADRVHGALGRKAERLNDTTIGFPEESLAAAERQKLLAQGILVQPVGAKPGGTGRKRRR